MLLEHDSKNSTATILRYAGEGIPPLSADWDPATGTWRFLTAAFEPADELAIENSGLVGDFLNWPGRNVLGKDDRLRVRPICTMTDRDVVSYLRPGTPEGVTAAAVWLGRYPNGAGDAIKGWARGADETARRILAKPALEAEWALVALRAAVAFAVDAGTSADSIREACRVHGDA